MHIVTIKRLQQAADEHKEAASEITSWIKIVRPARWKNFVELRASFPDADDVDSLVVFNIRHNRYRLIVAVHYVKELDLRTTLGHIYIGAFMTHKEYDRWSKLTKNRREEWLQF